MKKICLKTRIYLILQVNAFFFSEFPRLQNQLILLLISALDTTNVQIKKQVFELLSALCVYSSEGYNRALEALEHYKSFRSERYRFKLIVDELRGAKATEYQTTLLAFVNCLIISTPQLKVGTDPLLLPVIRSQKQPNPTLLCNWQKKTQRRLIVKIGQNETFYVAGSESGS